MGISFAESAADAVALKLTSFVHNLKAARSTRNFGNISDLLIAQMASWRPLRLVIALVFDPIQIRLDGAQFMKLRGSSTREASGLLVDVTPELSLLTT